MRFKLIVMIPVAKIDSERVFYLTSLSEFLLLFLTTLLRDFRASGVVVSSHNSGFLDFEFGLLVLTIFN